MYNSMSYLYACYIQRRQLNFSTKGKKGEKNKYVLTGLGVYVKEDIVNTFCTLQTYRHQPLPGRVVHDF